MILMIEKIELKMKNDGKIHLKLDEQNFELSSKNARYMSLMLKKVLKLNKEYNFFHHPEKFKEE